MLDFFIFGFYCAVFFVVGVNFARANQFFRRRQIEMVEDEIENSYYLRETCKQGKWRIK